jgi:predicted ATPase
MTGEDMTETTDRFVVVTGGPGSGKTTLIEALAAQGFRSSPEAGRAIIRDQRAIDGQGLPWADRALFAELMLGADMRSYREAPAEPEMVIFDRGIPDIAGYLRLCSLAIPGHVDRAARQFRYRREVFIAPPWPEIYEGDAERRGHGHGLCRLWLRAGRAAANQRCRARRLHVGAAAAGMKRGGMSRARRHLILCGECEISVFCR